ncbi:MAG: DUF3631 domain-containing protein [Acidobacteriaceae bacterium]
MEFKTKRKRPLRRRPEGKNSMSKETLSREEILEQARRNIDSPAILLRDIEAFFRRFIVLPDSCYLPLASWALATHVYEMFHAFGYVALQSPVRGCGKTRVLEVLECVCARPWRVNSVTPAVIFRKIGGSKPTLLLDEIEILNGKQKSENTVATIAILNAGYRAGAVVARCEGKDFKVVDFPVYCPKIFACIGGMPDTISDRCIVIRMQKALPGQKVERFSEHRLAPEAAELRQRIEPMMFDVANRIRGAYEALPPLTFLRDRQEEIWQPLFATLSVLDSSRMDELRKCALALTATKTADDEDGQTNLKLLADIRAIWPDGYANMSSATLVEKLRGLEESPWAEFELNARRLAHRLRPFGIQTRQVRIGSVTVKGYLRTEFDPAFSRYLAIVGDLSETSETTRMDIGENDDFASET